MKKDIYKVLSTQFLTAFADNAVLFTAITMIMQQIEIGDWYIPALQASFLVAYVIFAPWVGSFADARPKRGVMLFSNLVKAAGASLLLLHIEPMLSYAVIGLGAAMYSPAKYGILPELVEENKLVKANGWIEGSTILAILSGTLVGAALAEHSISVALIMVIVLYFFSAMIAWTIQHKLIVGASSKNPLKTFYSQMRGLLETPRARFATLGVSLFWAAATVLRVLLIAWAPVVLFIYNTTDIALLTMFVAIGIAVGSILAPKLIPIAYLRRARLAAYAMGLVIILLSFMDNIWAVRSMLFLAGMCGGLFVVPINAALQEIGHRSIGAGGAVAVQNFFENFAMLIASGIYAVIAGASISPVTTMTSLGGIVVILTLLVSMRLPEDTGDLNN
ncbi:MAG: lysophospholipid transporter LplT [endosymbiont of Galathealinum brachiosum]|uniref:Lysophospholipid transporter LplT n=1 Tax=endosymbiont of Galathealinum brachiosum TaxID=2200906 RepID=A0A370DI32_9GAMM|nr:MAG: lysophospholipid transporter LplT [endosymbiont of Galathealinum brachiosum]